MSVDLDVGRSQLHLLTESEVVVDGGCDRAPVRCDNYKTPGHQLVDLLRGEFYGLLYTCGDPAKQRELRSLNVWPSLRAVVSLLEMEEFQVVADSDESGRIDLEASAYTLDTNEGLEALRQLFVRTGGRTVRLLVFSASDEFVARNYPQLVTLSGVRQLANDMWELEFSNVQRVTEFSEVAHDGICLASAGGTRSVVNTSRGLSSNSVLNFNTAFAFVYSGDDNDPRGGEPIPKPEVLEQVVRQIGLAA